MSSIFESQVEYDGIGWIYAGDTPLHLAAAGHRIEITRMLLEAGANPNSVQSKRVRGPLHRAAEGFINSTSWNDENQIKTMKLLLDSGADIDLQDINGATPLHRAVRTRCARAVEYLFNRGCNPLLKNKSGSTPFHLAVQNTGRGGTGTEKAIEFQKQIILMFIAHGAKTSTKDGRGRSVVDCSRSTWILDILSNYHM